MIFKIFKKELLETLRDKRTLLVMIVIPTLMFPILFLGSKKYINSLKEKVESKTLKVGYVGDNALLQNLKNTRGEVGQYVWKQYEDTAQICKAIQEDSLDVGLYCEANFDELISNNKSARVIIIHDATDMGYKERLEEKIVQYNTQISHQRLEELNIDKSIFSAIEIGELNVATMQEMLGKLAGGMIPYIFIFFGFTGCMYPAIDLFTGEKERGTVETLLTTPVPRWKILFGKMGVVVLTGLLSVVFALGGLFFSVQNTVESNSFIEISTIIDSIISFKTIALMFALILPLMVFFAGVLIPISIYAKSFKEAQSIISPLMIVLILPAVIGVMPGVEFSVQTAFIPVVNTVLATKEIIAGTIDYTLYTGTLLSLIVLAVIGVLVSNKHFEKENNISSN